MRAESYDQTFKAVLNTGVFLLGALLLLWAFLILVLQCIGWIRAGAWQPVAVGALFLSPDGQTLLKTMSVHIHPLDLVPSLGSSNEIAFIPGRVVRGVLGSHPAFIWLLGTPLIFWLWGFGLASLSIADRISKDP